MGVLRGEGKNEVNSLQLKVSPPVANSLSACAPLRGSLLPLKGQDSAPQGGTLSYMFLFSQKKLAKNVDFIDFYLYICARKINQ